VASFASIANASTKGVLLFLPEVKSGELGAYSNALTNAALAAVAPTVISVAPSIGYAGSSLDVVITGGGTNFGALSALSIGSGITVNRVTVISATQLQANITIAAVAAQGPRNVVVTTPLGPGVVETSIGTQQFAVGTTSVALVESLLPSQVARNSSQTIHVYGVNTHFDAGSTVTIDARGVSVGTVTVESATKLRVNVTVSGGASLGFAPFFVTTRSEVVSFGAGLLVVDVVAPPPALPLLTSVTPASGLRGTTLDIAVAGNNTHFIAGATIGSFSGNGIDVLSTTVASPTQATLRVNINAAASLGFRDVLLTTGGETAVKVSGFLVQASTVCDMNADGVIDKTDIAAIVALRNQPASVNRAADANGDGIINVLDARTCTTRCTKVNCAP
jgi:hypothetical protein